MIGALRENYGQSVISKGGVSSRRSIIRKFYLTHIVVTVVIMQRFFQQVLNGCNNPLCDTQTCATYRKKTSRRPFRPYTVLSARSIAAHLTSTDHPTKKICPYIKEERSATDDSAVKYNQLKRSGHLVNVSPEKKSDGDALWLSLVRSHLEHEQRVIN